MQSSARDNYLQTEVMTATPQKLQYMLIDAAIRNIQRGKHLRNEGHQEEACEALIRAQGIITQILTGLNHEAGAELTRKVASIYMFVFRALNEAQLSGDDAKLDECVRVLEVERETWRLLCEKLEEEESAKTGVAPAGSASTPQPADSPPAPAPPMPGLDLCDDDLGGESPTAGFSIEA